MSPESTTDDAGNQAFLPPGTVLEDKYEITGYLGCGGMGSLYRAIHTKLGNEVAIKILHPRHAEEHDSVMRFQREAQIISELRHKNILAVHAFNAWNGTFYIAMELVEGESLMQLIEKSGRLRADNALPLLLQICDAMTFAHSNNVLHRDLKPDNVLVVEGDNEQCIKVVDFGLAKLVGTAEMQRLTRTGEVIGDPNYMSPEQCQGSHLDSRSDVYSFGCLMYESFTGMKPFASDSAVATLVKQVSEDPEPFAKELNVPAAIEQITFKAMEKDPSQRYESFEAIAADLRAFAANPNKKWESSTTWHNALKAVRPRATRRRIIGGQSPSRRLGLILLLAIPVLGVALFLWQSRWTAPTPYANLSQSDLRQTAIILSTSLHQLSVERKFERAQATEDELQNMRKYLLDDPYTNGIIDFERGRYREYVFEENANKTAARESIDLFKKAASKFKDAYDAAKKNNDSYNDSYNDRVAKMQMDESDKRYAASLNLLRHMSASTGDYATAVGTARKVLELYENRKDRVEDFRRQVAMLCFNCLIQRALAHKQFARAERIALRKIAFLKRQQLDPRFISQETEDLLADLEKANPPEAARVRKNLLAFAIGKGTTVPMPEASDEDDKLIADEETAAAAAESKQKHHPN